MKKRLEQERKAKSLLEKYFQNHPPKDEKIIYVRGFEMSLKQLREDVRGGLK